MYHDSTPPPPNRRRKTKDEAKGLILALCQDSDRPVLIGVVAIKLGVLWSLEDTEELFNELVFYGKLRTLTKEESVRYDVRHGYLLATPKQ